MQNTKISLLSSLLDSNLWWLHAPAHHINPVNLDQQWLRFAPSPAWLARNIWYSMCCLCSIGWRRFNSTLRWYSRSLYGIIIITFCQGSQLGGDQRPPCSTDGLALATWSSVIDLSRFKVTAFNSDCFNLHILLLFEIMKKFESSNMKSGCEKTTLDL